MTGGDFGDILYTVRGGVARITINRPERLNAFRARTVDELIAAFRDAWQDRRVGVVVLAGAGDRAFCVGGDQKERDAGGCSAGTGAGIGLDVETLYGIVASIPKPVIAAVQGYAIGGGHVLHLVCDMTIASEQATFGQVGPRVGSFDAGFGTVFLARVVGHKKARELWYLCERYSASEAQAMGLVNRVVPAGELAGAVDAWCERILDASPTALRMLKASFNTDVMQVAGVAQMSLSALELYYRTDEAEEGRRAFAERRPPDFRRFRDGVDPGTDIL